MIRRLDQPAPAALRRVLDRYGAARGSLLAGGLAYAALFAIVSGVLLLAGVVGLVVGVPAERARVVETIAGVLPPMREFIEVVLGEAARDAAPVSIVGAVALIWGASRFAIAFEDAVALVMRGDRRRSVVTRNLAALAAVVLLIGVIFASAILSGVVAFIEAGEALGVLRLIGDAAAIALGLLPIAATIAVTILVYRIVPTPAPPWNAVIVPGVVVALALAALARAFVFVAPRLLGATALLGSLATAFAALLWLGLSFQAILFGVAWVRERFDPTAASGADSPPA